MDLLYSGTLGSYIFKSVFAAAAWFPKYEEPACRFRCFLAFWITLYCLQYNRAICCRNTSKKVRFSNGVTPQASGERAGRGIWLNTTELILRQKWVFSVPLWLSHVSYLWRDSMNSQRSDQNRSQVNICYSLFGNGWCCTGPKLAQNLCSSWQSHSSALHEFQPWGCTPKQTSFPILRCHNLHFAQFLQKSTRNLNVVFFPPPSFRFSPGFSLRAGYVVVVLCVVGAPNPVEGEKSFDMHLAINCYFF